MCGMGMYSWQSRGSSILSAITIIAALGFASSFDLHRRAQIATPTSVTFPGISSVPSFSDFNCYPGGVVIYDKEGLTACVSKCKLSTAEETTTCAIECMNNTQKNGGEKKSCSYYRKVRSVAAYAVIGNNFYAVPEWEGTTASNSCGATFGQYNKTNIPPTSSNGPWFSEGKNICTGAADLECEQVAKSEQYGSCFAFLKKGPDVVCEYIATPAVDKKPGTPSGTDVQIYKGKSVPNSGHWKIGDPCPQFAEIFSSIINPVNAPLPPKKPTPPKDSSNPNAGTATVQPPGADNTDTSQAAVLARQQASLTSQRTNAYQELQKLGCTSGDSRQQCKDLTAKVQGLDGQIAQLNSGLLQGAGLTPPPQNKANNTGSKTGSKDCDPVENPKGCTFGVRASGFSGTSLSKEDSGTSPWLYGLIGAGVGYLAATMFSGSDDDKEKNQNCTTAPEQPSGCTNGTWRPLYGGRYNCIVSWQCIPAPVTQPVATLSCSPSDVAPGDQVSIQYSCSAGTPTGLNFTASASPVSVTAPSLPSGANSGTYTYGLTCNNQGAVGQAQCSVNISRQTPIASLSCAPSTVDVGSDVTLTYSCSSGTAAGAGFSAASSSPVTVVATAPTSGASSLNFGLTCTDAGLTGTAQCSVQVARPSLVFLANPSSISSGAHSTLGWTTSGMSSCVVSSTSLSDFTSQNASNTAVNGSVQTPALTATTDFTLTCTTLGGNTRTATATVTVQ